MKKLFLILGVVIALLITFSYSSSASAASMAPQNGISIQALSSTDFASESFKRSVDQAINANVNYISLVISVHQSDKYSNNVTIDNNTATDASIISAANYIHSKGAKVSIAVHDDVYDGTWRAMIAPTIPSVWFTNYGSILTHYAALAQSAGIDEFSLGTEMSSMTTTKYTNNWISMINSVRATYKGSVTYSAQHAGDYSDAQSLGFWPNLDAIGISAYYPMDGATSKADLLAQWKKWDQLEVSVLAARYNKPIIFTEVGFVSRDQSTVDPGTGYQLTTPINTTLQATAYDALLEYYHNSSILKGVFLWDWVSDPSAGGYNDGNYTPQNKPAEAVMKQWFSSIATPTLAGVYAATLTPSSPVKNSATTSTVAVTTPYPVVDALVDIEIYNTAGQRVAQQFVEHQKLSSSPTPYTITWTPTQSGTYTVKVGLFTANWQSNLYWNDAAGKVTVTDAVAPVTPTVPPVTPTPPVVPTTPPVMVTPPTTPTVPPTATPVTPPIVLPTAINIWWPSNGSAVSGVQPFKATIDGRSLATYDLYWQVGDGQLNPMYDSNVDAPHKEVGVDLSGWNWSGDKKYVITFVAKAKDGSIASKKSTTIIIN